MEPFSLDPGLALSLKPLSKDGGKGVRTLKILPEIGKRKHMERWQLSTKKKGGN
jgi:hypothetical protein